MVRLFRISVIVTFLLELSSLAYSQSIATDTIEIESISIYRNRNSIDYIPGTKVESIDSMVFKEKTFLSLAELLGENSPIFIKTYGRGATATASFRGTGASHTQVFWNGLKINSPMSGQVDFSQIPLYFIDNVSIHFGQSSMNFGSGGLGGSVNLGSSPDWSKKNGAKIYQSVGSYSSFSTGVNATYGSEKVKLQTRIFRESSQNNFAYRNKAKPGYPTEIQENADYHNYGLLQEAYYRPNAKNVVSFRLWAQQNERGIPRIMSNYSAIDKNRQNDKILNSVIDWNWFGSTSKFVVTMGVSALSLDYIYSKYNNGSEDPNINGENNSLSWNNGASYHVTLSKWLSANLEVTQSFHKAFYYEKRLLNGYSAKQNQFAIRTKLIATPFERLSVSILLNEEYIRETLSPIMPSISVEYKVLKDNDLKIKGSIARNFHYPSLNDLYWPLSGNPNMLPENGLYYDGGIKFENSHENLKLSSDFTLFASEVENWIMWLPNLEGHIGNALNIPFVSVRGIETSVSLVRKVERFTLKLQGSYSHTRSSVEKSNSTFSPKWPGKQLPFIPVHSGGLVFNAHWKNYYLIYSFSHFSERFTTTSNNSGSFRKLSPYYMSSASIGKDFTAFKSRFGIQLRIDNLLNESYQSILWRPMPGRNYSLLFRIDL